MSRPYFLSESFLVPLIFMAFLVVCMETGMRHNDQQEVREQLKEHLPYLELAGQNYYKEVLDYYSEMIKEGDFASDSLRDEMLRPVSDYEQQMRIAFYCTYINAYSNLPLDTLPLLYQLPLKSPDDFPNFNYKGWSRPASKSGLEKAWTHWQPAKQKFDSLYVAAGYLDK